MGPKQFENKWVKQLTGFNETKIFFFHDKSKTTLKYIDGDNLLGVEMYREDYEIAQWLGHFQWHLDTGTFDTDAYWQGYNSVKDADGKIVDSYITPVTAVPMVLKKKLWEVYGPAMNKFMKTERLKDNSMGFRQQARP